jgi:hypothetical protein
MFIFGRIDVIARMIFPRWSMLIRSLICDWVYQRSDIQMSFEPLQTCGGPDIHERGRIRTLATKEAPLQEIELTRRSAGAR